MNCPLATGVMTAWCLLGTSSLVFAQTAGSDRPFRPLFGRGSQGTSGQSIDVAATLVQAYDDNLLAENGSLAPGAATLSGQYTMLQGRGSYSWSSQRVQVGITGTSAFRYYGQIGDVQSVSQSGGFGLSTTLPKRTSLAINQGVAYSPSYLSALFPNVDAPRLGDAPPASPNYAASDLASYSYRTTASLTHGLTRRGSITGGADYSLTDFTSEEDGRRDSSSYGARAEFSRSIGRHSGVSLGYRYQTGNFGFAAGPQSIGAANKNTEQGVNFGVTHTRILSATRRAEFSFGVGGSRSTVLAGVTGSVVPGETPILAPQRLFRVVGDGSVAYQFSRTGDLRLSYRRGVEYILQLTQPVFTDGVSASLSVAPARRVGLSMTAGYSSGASALQSSSQFDTYTANVRSHISMTRTLAAYVEYLYYFYDFGATPLLAPDAPRRLERNGISVGLTLSTPLFRR